MKWSSRSRLNSALASEHRAKINRPHPLPRNVSIGWPASPTGQIRLSLSQKSVQWTQSWTSRRGIGKTWVCEYQHAKLALALSGEKTRPHSRMGNDGESS